MFSIAFKIITHFIFGWEIVRRCREGHSWQCIKARGSEKAKRVPPAAPAISCSLMSIKNDKWKSGLQQVIAHSKASLSTANHNNLIAVYFMIVVHKYILNDDAK